MYNIFIHIGLGKTGTTAIQSMLDMNRQTLKQKGYFYTGCQFEHLKGTEKYDVPFSYFQMLLDLNDQELSNYFNEIFSKIFDYCESTGISNIIWSWEPLSGNFRKIYDVLRSATQGHCTKIIVYLRRQDEWAESSYQQWGVKHKANQGPILSFDEFFEQLAEDRHFDYYDRISPWTNAFGKENIIVRIYEKQQLKKGLFNDFFGTIGLDLTDEFKYPQKTIHPSFNNDVQEVIKIYNSLFDESHYPSQLEDLLNRSLSKQELKKTFESFSTIDPKKRYEILEKYGSSNKRVAMEYLGRKDGRLFYEPWPDPNEVYSPPQPLSVEAAVRIFLQIILYQEEQIQNIKYPRRRSHKAEQKKISIPKNSHVPEPSVYDLSGEDIARLIPTRRIIQAIAFKIGNQPGLGWLYRFRNLGKRLLGG